MNGMDGWIYRAAGIQSMSIICIKYYQPPPPSPGPEARKTSGVPLALHAANERETGRDAACSNRLRYSKSHVCWSRHSRTSNVRFALVLTKTLLVKRHFHRPTDRLCSPTTLSVASCAQRTCHRLYRTSTSRSYATLKKPLVNTTLGLD